MSFLRSMVGNAANMWRSTRQGDGFHGMNVDLEVIAVDAAATLTVAQLSKGGVQFTGFTAGRNITTPTAALMLAAWPDMDIGDTYVVAISCVAAFAGTYVAGAGVTLAGRATTPASSWSLIQIKKLSATTVEWRVL